MAQTIPQGICRMLTRRAGQIYESNTALLGHLQTFVESHVRLLLFGRAASLRFVSSLLVWYSAYWVNTSSKVDHAYCICQ
jgi:hypothetical protein